MDMPYADFAYYTGTYLGTALSEQEFPACARKASILIDDLTFGRTGKLSASQIPDAVRDAACSAAEIYADYLAKKNAALKATKSGTVKSESNDGFSVSYADYNAEQARISAESEMSEEITIYLAKTGLMFRGWSRKWDEVTE